MWKTFLVKLLFCLFGIFVSWAVLTSLLPVSLTLSPTVGITLFDDPVHQLIAKFVFSGICGIVCACIPNFISIKTGVKEES